jgi:two-component system, OmpR family, alkaline phosphatase synthesis response regulator PhoP
MKPRRQETVLIVEDDPALRVSLRAALRSAGFRVELAKDGAEGLAAALAMVPDLVLLDVMMPHMNGFEVCARIREKHATLPVLFVTAKGEEEDKVRGLGLGADDYVVKPFGVAELLARVNAALRLPRLREADAVHCTVGEAEVDFAQHRMTRDGHALEVTAHEMKLLKFFLDRDGMLLTRQQILDAVWGADYFGTDRTVDNFINRLRAKIERDPKRPRHLFTVRGAGYRFSRRGDDDPER